MGQATLVAIVIAVVYHYVRPDDKWIQLALIPPVMILWFTSLFVLRIIPKYHWRPIRHIAFSAFKGSALKFDPEIGLSALKPRERKALRTAVVKRMPVRELVTMPGEATDGADGADGADGDLAEWMISGDRNRDDSAEGTKLVRMMRLVGQRGGVPVAKSADVDAGISLFLFSDQPVAVRLAKMRELLASGSNAHELRTLEDIRDALFKAWGRKKADDGKPRRAKSSANGARSKRERSKTTSTNT
jgi:hypothetical protein